MRRKGVEVIFPDATDASREVIMTWGIRNARSSRGPHPFVFRARPGLKMASVASGGLVPVPVLSLSQVLAAGLPGHSW